MSTPTSDPTLNQTVVMPSIAGGVPVRWADPAALWLSAVGADVRGTEYSAAVVARVALRYDDDKADLVHNDEYEAVLHPLAAPVDPSRAAAVDYDDRDLRTDPPPTAAPTNYRLADAPIDTKIFWTHVERDLIAHLVRTRSLELLCNRDLKLYGRPGETADDFGTRCYQAADAKADVETAALRDKYETKVKRIQTQLQAAQEKTHVLQTQAEGRRNDEILSTAGSILGGLLGGRRSRGGILGSVLGKAGAAAGRHSRTSAASSRVDAAQHKAAGLTEQLDDLEAELAQEVMDIDTRWNAVSKNITTQPIQLEKADVSVIQLSLVWLPVAAGTTPPESSPEPTTE